MKLKFLFLALFLTISHIGNAETVSLPWKEIIIDDETILQFSNMNENEIIKTLRQKYKIKVLILDIKSSGNASVNSNLIRGGLEEDSKAVYYYTRYNQQMAESRYGGFIGEFFEPYSHPSNSDGFSHPNNNDGLERPYLEQPLIVLTLDASRMAIIHEFLHFYIYSLEKVKGKIEIDGIPHGRQCGKELLLEKEKVRINPKILKEVMRDDLSIEWIGYTTKSKEDIHAGIAALNYIKNNFDYQIGGVREELDIYYLSLKYKKELHLSEKEIIHILDNVSDYIHWIDIKIMDILPTRLVDSGVYCNHAGEETLKAKYEELKAFREDIKHKCSFSSKYR